MRLRDARLPRNLREQMPVRRGNVAEIARPARRARSLPDGYLYDLDDETPPGSEATGDGG